MTTRLSLIRGEARAASAFQPPPYRLGPRAQRPGELADVVAVKLDAPALEHAVALAKSAALPVPLVIVIAVESELALREAADASGLNQSLLAAALDDSAAEEAPSGFDPPATRRLRAYATAIRSGGRAECDSASTAAELALPHRLHARWSTAAQQSGLTLDSWLNQLLKSATAGRERWEATAADAGQTLAEWAALQALSCARRSSSAAQANASA
jgi:hypothetical protein